MSNRTSKHGIDHAIEGRVKEVTGQMVGDPGLEDAGLREQTTGVDPAQDTGGEALDSVLGAAKEVTGRAIGRRDLAARGRRQRRRRAPGDTPTG